MKADYNNFRAALPIDWNFDRLKDIVSLRNEKTDEVNAEEDYLELEDLESGTGRILGCRNTLDTISAVTLFRKGDVLFGKLRPYLEKYYLAEFHGKCTGEILAFKPERIAGRFLFYCIASPWFIEKSNMLAYGAKMPRVNWPTQLALFDIPLPPIIEQERIAAFLDASCAALDAAVAAKRRQIENLDRLKKSILHSAFDKPGWPAERIKDITEKICSGVTPEGGASGYLESGVPLLRNQNIHFEGLELDNVAYISGKTHSEMINSQLKARDVVLNITGASIGRCTFVPDDFGEGNVNQHVCIIRSGPNLNYRFLNAYLQSPMGQANFINFYWRFTARFKS